MYNLKETWRWFGQKDPISLSDIKMTGVKGIVTALHEVPIGEIWQLHDILSLKECIESNDLEWTVVESIPVHESIKYGGEDRDKYINNYIKSIENLSLAGINILCYNFMPVVDWTRTNLLYKYNDSSLALRFDIIDFLIFDVFMLKRDNSILEYSSEQLEIANERFNKMNSNDLKKLSNNILQGLPGSMVESYELDSFKEKLNFYKGKHKVDLQNNFKYFLEKIVPIAEKNKVYLALHPDDPPIDLFGIPRIVSDLNDYQKICNFYPSEYNGITLCVGSLASKECDIVNLLDKLLDKVNFVHLRNVKKDKDNIFKYSFTESNHLDGDVDMNYVLSKLLYKKKSFKIPFRPDHGHLIYDDILKENINPGYSYIGRLKGLSELNGIIYSLVKKISYEKIIFEIENSKHKVIPIVKNVKDLEMINFESPFIEFVLRDEDCFDELIKVKEKSLQITTVGTIVNEKEVDFCLENGINIFYSPHFDSEIVKYCLRKNSIIIPGVHTTTEIFEAYKLGVKLVKFFPSGNNMDSLKHYANVFDKLGIKFIANGGINKNNYQDFLKIKNVIGVGSTSIKEL